MSGDVTALVAKIERDNPRFDRERYEERVSIMAESSPRPEWQALLRECELLRVRAPGQLELTGRAT